MEKLRLSLAETNTRIVTEALSLEGIPSVPHGGAEEGLTPEEGFDCSGFVLYVLKKSGTPLKDGLRFTNQLFDEGGVHIHNQKPGDLIFFSKNGIAPDHVGIVLDEDRYIHAPGKPNRQVEIKQWNSRPIKNTTEHSLYLHNPIGFVRVAMKEGRWYSLVD